MFSNLSFLTILIAAGLPGLIAFAMINKSSCNNKQKNIKSFASIFGVFSIISIGASFLFSQDDFSYSFCLIELLSVLFLVLMIFITQTIEKTKRLSPIIILISSLVMASFIPDLFLLSNFPINIWLSKAIFALIFFIFGYGYKCINSLNNILIIQTTTISIGISFLCFFGLLPLLLGCMGIVLTALFLAFLLFSSKNIDLKPNDAFASSIGFLVAWLIIKSGTEISIQSTLLLATFFLLEFLLAIIKKLTFIEKYKNIEKNTIHFSANEDNIPPQLLRNIVLKIMIISLFMCAFQVFSPNYFSIPIFAILAISWFISSLKNWKTETQSIKEISKEAIKDIKDNVSEISKLIKKD